MPKIIKPVSLNAHLFKAWIKIMEAANADRIHILIVPQASKRELSGLPPKRMKETLENGNLVLNISKNACRFRHVDTENGILSLDISLGGQPCPNVSIPIEAIVDIFSPDIEGLSSLKTFLPIHTNGARVLFVKGQVVRLKTGLEGIPNFDYDEDPREVEDLSSVTQDYSGPPVNSSPESTPPKRGHLSVVK
jgi:hypothetical protein